MLRRVALVRTDVSECLIASINTVKRIGELGTALAATSNRCTLYSCIQVYSDLVLTVCQKLINIFFKIFLFFIPEMSAGYASYIVKVIPYYFTWIL
jgi:hypothetical protein